MLFAFYLSQIRRIWVAKFDPLEENRKLAEELWTSVDLERYPDLSSHLLEDIVHPVSCVRHAASDALAEVLKDTSHGPKEVGALLGCLLETYEDKLVVTPPIVDGLGRIVVPSVDHWEPRSGIAIALAKISTFLDSAMVKKVASFFVQEGFGPIQFLISYSV